MGTPLTQSWCSHLAKGAQLFTDGCEYCSFIRWALGILAENCGCNFITGWVTLHAKWHKFWVKAMFNSTVIISAIIYLIFISPTSSLVAGSVCILFTVYSSMPGMYSGHILNIC